MKIAQGIPHFDQIAVKISVLGVLYSNRCTDGGEIWQGEDLRSPPSCQISPPSAQNQNRPLSKLNTGALRFSQCCSLQVINKRKVTRKILFTISMDKDSLFYTPKNVKICGWITKSKRLKMQYVCIFFHICRKFEFLISQGCVPTCLRW